MSEKFLEYLKSIPKRSPEVGAIVGINSHELNDALGGMSGRLLRIEEEEGKKIGIVEVPGKGEFRIPFETLMDLND